MGLSEEQILLTLVQGSEGKAWAENQEGWDPKNHDGICFWDGVNCDPETSTIIEGIYLPATGVTGTIPSELGLLTSLREISIPKNILQGTIPTQVAALPNLEVFNFAENELTGTLPTFGSSLLISISVAKNLLTGTLSDDFGTRYPKLKELDVFDNNFSGPLPSSFSLLKNAESMSLSQNNFYGTIPSGFGGVHSLKFLYLNDNKLVGTIPISIASIRSPMEELWLQHNMLSGTVPAAVGSMQKLHDFYIDGNKFTGTIPEQLCREDLNADFFEGVPENVTRDICDSIACPAGEVSFDGLYPCKPCSNKFINPYLGRQGRCIDMEVDEVLKTMYESMGGQDWIDGLEWDREDYDNYCTFKSIDCDSKGNIIAMDFKGMNLRGTIPEEIGFLQYLKTLDLSDNFLTGFLPSDLRWAPLEKLDVSGNQLAGMVPPMLCLKPGINGNGDDGEFGCEYIACPVGTMSSTGYGVAVGDGEQCKPCKSGGGYYLASKSCSLNTPTKARSSKGSGKMSGLAIFGTLIGVLAALHLVIFIFLKARKRKNTKDKDRHYSVPQNDWGLSLGGANVAFYE